MSRAVIVLGMHRSGTSVITRGLKTLGVHLGTDLLGPRPDNPTGFWEDRAVMNLNERIFKVIGMKWHTVSIIGNVWESSAMNALTMEAVKLLKRRFTKHAIWGFKDPRTVRLLPFWLRVFRHLNVKDSYLISLRKPADVAKSLYERQRMPAEQAYRLSLVHVGPYLHLVAGKPVVAVDYDRLMDDPRRELVRVRSALKLPNVDGQTADTIEHFAEEFLRPALRHAKPKTPSADDGKASGVMTTTYKLLYKLAVDRVTPAAFWPAWRKQSAAVRTFILGPNGQPMGAERNPLLGI